MSASAFGAVSVPPLSHVETALDPSIQNQIIGIHSAPDV